MMNVTCKNRYVKINWETVQCLHMKYKYTISHWGECPVGRYLNLAGTTKSTSDHIFVFKFKKLISFKRQNNRRVVNTRTEFKICSLKNIHSVSLKTVNERSIYFGTHTWIVPTTISCWPGFKDKVTMAAIRTVSRQCSRQLFRCLPRISNESISNGLVFVKITY